MNSKIIGVYGFLGSVLVVGLLPAGCTSATRTIGERPYTPPPPAAPVANRYGPENPDCDGDARFIIGMQDCNGEDDCAACVLPYVKGHGACGRDAKSDTLAIRHERSVATYCVPSVEAACSGSWFKGLDACAASDDCLACVDAQLAAQPSCVTTEDGRADYFDHYCPAEGTE